MEAIQALAVSQETAKGGDAINEDRAARGFAPLEVQLCHKRAWLKMQPVLAVAR